MYNSDVGQGSKQIYANLNLKLGCFNIQGQNKKNTTKLRKIKRLFTKGDFDILLLQETRSDGSDSEYRRWCNVFGSKQIYLTSLGSSSVGAGIIVRNEESFKVDHIFKDPRGRYVGIMGDHEDARFLILSFYSPSVDNDIKHFVTNELCVKLFVA